jgi:hypothetical protein
MRKASPEHVISLRSFLCPSHQVLAVSFRILFEWVILLLRFQCVAELLYLVSQRKKSSIDRWPRKPSWLTEKIQACHYQPPLRSKLSSFQNNYA